MDAVALDRAEQTLTLLAELLPGWSLAWDQSLGMWTVRSPNGRIQGAERSPLDAITLALSRVRAAVPNAMCM